MTRRTLLLLLLLLPLAAWAENPRVDLNSCSKEELSKLPLTADEVNAIWERVYFGGPLNSIYDLRDLPVFKDTARFLKLKELVTVSPPPAPENIEDQAGSRIYAINYRLSQWSSDERISDNYLDLWIDLLRAPPNINDIGFRELMSLPSVSAQSATAILDYRKSGGRINSMRDYRVVPGLSPWAYIGSRAFLAYGDVRADRNRLKGYYSLRMTTSPADADRDAMLAQDYHVGDSTYQAWNQTVQERGAGLGMTQKLHLSYGPVTAGAFWGNEQMQLVSGNHYAFPWQTPVQKFYVGVRDIKTSGWGIKQAILGNYNMSLGQGVVFESGDYYKNRMLGVGYDKRYSGITPDVSTGHEWGLSGGALVAGSDWLDLTAFYSDARRDYILAPDSAFNASAGLARSPDSLPNTDAWPAVLPIDCPLAITDQDLLTHGFAPFHNTVREQLWGVDLEGMPILGTRLGVNFYRADYSRPIISDPAATVLAGDFSRIGPEDAEWTQALGAPNNRRVVGGFHFLTVYDNWALSGEYGEMLAVGDAFKLGDAPKAGVLSLHGEWANSELLVLFRHTDVEFDNPYQRSFSNYERYKSTIYDGNPYYLLNPVYTSIYNNSQQPQSETGIFARYNLRLIRTLSSGVDFDSWERNSDHARYMRVVGRLGWDPVAPVHVQIRQKWLGRALNETPSVGRFYSEETIINLRVDLSAFDQMSLFYFTTATEFPPRPRFTVNSAGNAVTQGSALLPGQSLGTKLVHNFTRELSGTVSAMIYQGFLWTYEDGSFLALDAGTREGLRSYMSLNARISENLSLYARYGVGVGKTATSLYLPAGSVTLLPEYQTTPQMVHQTTDHDFRIQLDVTF